MLSRSVSDDALVAFVAIGSVAKKKFFDNETLVNYDKNFFVSHRKSQELLKQVRKCCQREPPFLGHFSTKLFLVLELSIPESLLSVIKTIKSKLGLCDYQEDEKTRNQQNSFFHRLEILAK